MVKRSSPRAEVAAHAAVSIISAIVGGYVLVGVFGRRGNKAAYMISSSPLGMYIHHQLDARSQRNCPRPASETLWEQEGGPPWPSGVYHSDAARIVGMHSDELGPRPAAKIPAGTVDNQTAAKLRQYRQVVELAGTYHDEAVRCAESGCFLAACVMLGAMLEAGLLAMAMAYEEELKADRLWPAKEKRPPVEWNGQKLVDLALSAGWLETGNTGAEGDVTEEEIRGLMKFVTEQRNRAAHPGRYARESQVNTDLPIRPNAYETAYEIVRSAFDHTYAFLNDETRTDGDPAT
jgi:hypothetical protein